jgi:DNA adenine methylase
MDRSGTLDRLPAPRPFLKWVGGKRQLLLELRRFVPEAFGAYHEPFLGSGALFFDLWRHGRLEGRRCCLADVNPDLIGCYRAIAGNVEAVVAELAALAAAHAADPVGAYYRVRDEHFNPRRRALVETGGIPDYPPDLAAMFVYLNRTGYNGLFRLNARGEFNVPAGRYANPKICDEATLRSVASALRAPGVTLRHLPFAAVAERAAAGDLVYFDPPYAPLTATARFTSYTRDSFTEEDQRQLQALVFALARRGCHVVVSNSTAPLVTALYDTPAARAVGLKVHRVSARRAINSIAERRGAVQEYIISNVPPAGGRLSASRVSARAPRAAD